MKDTVVLKLNYKLKIVNDLLFFLLYFGTFLKYLASKSELLEQICKHLHGP